MKNMQLSYKDFNQFEYKQLVKMDGIGKTVAKCIIAARPFRTNADLFKVKRLGAKTLLKYGIIKERKRKPAEQLYDVEGEQVSAKYLAQHKTTGVINYFWRIPKEHRIYL